MTVRGVGVSTRLAGAFFGFEMLVLDRGVGRVAMAKNGGHLSVRRRSSRSNMTRRVPRPGGQGFPLAVYLFIGWENSAALAEETGNPRRNVPRAVFLSIAMMGVGYVLFAYATVSGSTTTTAPPWPGATVPFITVAHGALWQAFALFAWLAGLTSTLGRAHRGRELAGPADLQRRPGAGCCRRWLGQGDSRSRQTPRERALRSSPASAASSSSSGCLRPPDRRRRSTAILEPVQRSSSSPATMGTHPGAGRVRAGEPRRCRSTTGEYRRPEFSVVKHADAAGRSGLVAIGVPVYYLAKPGQSAAATTGSRMRRLAIIVVVARASTA